MKHRRQHFFHHNHNHYNHDVLIFSMMGLLKQNEQLRQFLIMMNPLPSPQVDSSAIVIIGMMYFGFQLWDIKTREALHDAHCMSVEDNMMPSTFHSKIFAGCILPSGQSHRIAWWYDLMHVMVHGSHRYIVVVGRGVVGCRYWRERCLENSRMHICNSSYVLQNGTQFKYEKNLMSWTDS